MIIVKISGGLGNQMFQYNFYNQLKKKFGDVYIDNSFFSRVKQHNGYELEKVFGLKLPIASEKQIKALKSDTWKLYRKLLDKAFGIPPTRILQGDGYCYRDVFNDNKYYDGVWMNLRYISSSDEIRNIFKFKNHIPDKNKLIAEEMSRCNSVALHVRRGDYVNNPVHGGVCTGTYYNKAMNIMNECLHEPQYYIFSDDSKWVKDNWHMKNMTVIDWNTGDDSYWDMYLMSCCKHNIIANSTFSWWGAFLNKNPNKIVIGPRYWFAKEVINHKESAADALMLKGWLRIY